MISQIKPRAWELQKLQEAHLNLYVIAKKGITL